MDSKERKKLNQREWRNAEIIKEKSRIWREKNPDYKKKYDLKKKVEKMDFVEKSFVEDENCDINLEEDKKKFLERFV